MSRNDLSAGGQRGIAHQSLLELVIDELRKAIFQGDYKPGDRLVEYQLAETFNVSRNPIREALRVLATEGIVEVNPRKGARVRRLSREEVEEIIELRAELEGLSARFAAKRCTADIREAIEALLEKAKNAEKQNDNESLYDLNMNYHTILADAGRNRYLSDFMRSLRERTYWLFESARKERAVESWREHAAILEAIKSGDAEFSFLLASRHVKQVGDLILSKITDEA